MAMNAEEAQEMLDTAQRQGVTLGVCHNFRFQSAFLRAKDLIEQGALGQILSAEVFWKMSSYGPGQRKLATPWMTELPGGVIQEVLPHLVYMLLAVMGDIKLVSAAVGVGGVRKEHGDLRVLFDSRSGPAVLGLSLRATPVQKFLRILGTRMCLHVDIATDVLIRLRSRQDSAAGRAAVNLAQSVQLATGTLVNAVRYITGRLPRSHETLIASYYESARRGEAPPVGGEEGLAVTVVMDDVWEALGIGHEHLGR